MVKNVVILGSTGSIGRHTIEVLNHFGDRFKVVGLAANRNVKQLLKQCEEVRPVAVSIGDEGMYREFCREAKPGFLENVFFGTEGLVALAAMPDVHIVVNALVGGAALVQGGQRPVTDLLQAVGNA